MRILRHLCTLIWGISLFAGLPARAQQEDDKKDILTPAYILNAHLGTFLPNQINGVTEVLPMWSFGYGIPSRKGFLEFGADLANAKGLSYYIAHVGYRGDFQVEDLLITADLGVDVHFYKQMDTIDPNTGLNAQSPFSVYGGGHISGGLLAHIGDQLWFKGIMKFNINPGASLYVGFGFELRPGKENNTEEKPKP